MRSSMKLHHWLNVLILLGPVSPVQAEATKPLYGFFQEGPVNFVAAFALVAENSHVLKQQNAEYRAAQMAEDEAKVYSGQH